MSYSNRAKKLIAVVGALGLAVTLSACAADADPLAQEQKAGADYVSGDFRVVSIPVAERGEPVVFSGVTETGEDLSSQDTLGAPVVVNFWFAACGPCRVEAAELNRSFDEFGAQGVSYIGINTVDQAATAKAFSEEYEVEYPSLLAANNSELKLAFASAAPITATPTTLVLDAEGRVAGRIIGQLPGASVLNTLVRETLAEAQ